MDVTKLTDEELDVYLDTLWPSGAAYDAALRENNHRAVAKLMALPPEKESS